MGVDIRLYVVHHTISQNLVNDLVTMTLSPAIVTTGLQGETDLALRPVIDGERVTGVYCTVLLASGRFAMLDDGMGLSLMRRILSCLT